MTLWTRLILVTLINCWVLQQCCAGGPPTTSFAVRTGAVTCTSEAGEEVARGHALTVSRLSAARLAITDRNGATYPLDFRHTAGRDTR